MQHATVIIDIWALLDNYSQLRANSAPVLKADAYGHGLITCATNLAHFANCPVLCCGYPCEGVAMREAGVIWSEIIPLFGCLSNADFAACATYRLTTLIYNSNQIAPYLSNINRHVSPSPVALKFDIGMSRLGFNPSDIPGIAKQIAHNPHANLVWLIAHLPHDNAKANRDAIETALTIWNETREIFPHCQLSLGASASLVARPLKGVWRRPGLALYGVNPSGIDLSRKFNLEPVMSFGAPVVEVRKLAKGAGVSYGSTFKAPRDMTIAVVAMGYANGVSRSFSGKIALRLNGKICPQVGLICMNMLMIDATDTGAKIGDTAWLFDNGNPDIDIYTGQFHAPAVMKSMLNLNPNQGRVTLAENFQAAGTQSTFERDYFLGGQHHTFSNLDHNPSTNFNSNSTTKIAAPKKNIANDYINNNPSIRENETNEPLEHSPTQSQYSNPNHQDSLNEPNHYNFPDNTILDVNFLSKCSNTPPWQILSTIGRLNPRIPRR